MPAPTEYSTYLDPVASSGEAGTYTLDEGIDGDAGSIGLNLTGWNGATGLRQPSTTDWDRYIVNFTSSGQFSIEFELDPAPAGTFLRKFRLWVLGEANAPDVRADIFYEFNGNYAGGPGIGAGSGIAAFKTGFLNGFGWNYIDVEVEVSASGSGFDASYLNTTPIYLHFLLDLGSATTCKFYAMYVEPITADTIVTLDHAHYNLVPAGLDTTKAIEPSEVYENIQIDSFDYGGAGAVYPSTPGPVDDGGPLYVVSDNIVPYEYIQAAQDFLWVPSAQQGFCQFRFDPTLLIDYGSGERFAEVRLWVWLDDFGFPDIPGQVEVTLYYVGGSAIVAQQTFTGARGWRCLEYIVGVTGAETFDANANGEEEFTCMVKKVTTGGGDMIIAGAILLEVQTSLTGPSGPTVVEKSFEAQASIQETETKSFQAQASIQESVSQSFGAQANIAGGCGIYLDPDETISGAGTGWPDPSAHTTLNDDPIREPTWPGVGGFIAAGVSGASFTRQVGFETFTLPVNERVSTITIWGYWGADGPNSVYRYKLYTGTTLLDDTGDIAFSGEPADGWYSRQYTVPGSFSQAEIDALRVEVYGMRGVTGASNDVLIQSLYLEVCTEFQALTKSFEAQAAISESEEQSFEAQAVIGDTIVQSFEAQATISESFSKSFGAQALISRFLTTAHLCPTPKVRALIEVDWPGGNRRYSSEDLAVDETGYDGRVLEMGDIVQSTGAEKGSFKFTLENTPFVDTIESLWSDTNPPEGAAVRVYYRFEDEPLTHRILLFSGVVEHVEEVTEEQIKVSAFVNLEKYDVLIGSTVEEAEFADAPDESRGKFKPIVFGTVERMQGVPVTTVAVSNVAASVLAADTSIELEDATLFPGAPGGTIRILEETVTYTGKTGNTLTGCTRAATGVATDYPAGTEVVEVTDLEVLIAGHEIDDVTAVYAASGERLRLLDPSEYTVDLTPQGKVTFAGGKPTVPVPAGGSQFQQIQFDAAGAGNTATNPTNACADVSTWTEKNVATAPGGTTLVVEQTTPQPVLGDILKAWAMVEFDATSIPSGGATIQAQGAAGTVALTASGNLPSDIKNRAGLGFTRAYDDVHTPPITDPTHAHAATNKTYSQFCDTVEVISGAVNNPEYAIDGTFHLAADIAGITTTIRARLTGLPSAYNSTMVGIKARIDGKRGTPATTFAWALVVNGSTVKSGTIGTTRTGAGDLSGHGGAYTSVTWAQMVQTNTYLQVSGLDSADDIWEMWYEIEYAEVQNAAATGVSSSQITPLLHTVATLQDVTALAAGDWTWFANRTISVVSTGTGTLKVVRVSFILEVSGHRIVPADRFLFDVEGLEPLGRPTKILEAILTHSYMLALPGTPYGDMTGAAAALALLSYRLDFALTEQPRAADLLSKVCEQSRLLHYWEGGVLRVKFRPDIASMAEPLTTFQKDDIVEGSVSRRRTVLAEVVSQLEVRYRYTGEKRKTTRNYIASETPAAGIGDRPATMDLDLIQDDTSAASFADWSVERTYRPRYVLSFETYLPGLEVELGEIVGIVTNRFSYAKLEVTAVIILETRVRFVCIVWDSI